MLRWFQSGSPPEVAAPNDCISSLGDKDSTSMVADWGPDRASLQTSLASAGNGTILDYGALKHLKWSPRRQPERAVEVSRAIRDVVDRSKLRKVLQHPAPSRKMLRDQFKALDIEPGKQQQWEEAILAEWWNLNTALYFLIAPAVVLDGPLARSDTELVEQRFVRGAWRDGKAYYNWLMKFGKSDDSVNTQQYLHVKFDNAQLHHTADLAKLQGHCDELANVWSRIVGNHPEKPHSYVWRLLTSLPVEPTSSRIVQLRTWLSECIADESAFGIGPLELNEALYKRAEVLGLSASKPSILAVVKDQCKTCDTRGCKGGSQCVMLNDSIDISKESADKQAYIVAGRALRAQSNLKTLKGVAIAFTRTDGTTGGGKKPAPAKSSPPNQVTAVVLETDARGGQDYGGPNREPFEDWFARYCGTAPASQVTMVGAFTTPTATPVCKDCDNDSDESPRTIEELQQQLREIKAAVGGLVAGKQELSAHRSPFGSRLSTPSTVRLGTVDEDEGPNIPSASAPTPTSQPLQVSSTQPTALDLLWQSLEKAVEKLPSSVAATGKKSPTSESAIELMAKSVVKSESDARQRDQLKMAATKGRLAFVRSVFDVVGHLISLIGGRNAVIVTLSLKICAPMLARVFAKLTLAVSDWSWATMGAGASVLGDGLRARIASALIGVAARVANAGYLLQDRIAAAPVASHALRSGHVVAPVITRAIARARSEIDSLASNPLASESPSESGVAVAQQVPPAQPDAASSDFEVNPFHRRVTTSEFAQAKAIVAHPPPTYFGLTASPPPDSVFCSNNLSQHERRCSCSRQEWTRLFDVHIREWMQMCNDRYGRQLTISYHELDLPFTIPFPHIRSWYNGDDDVAYTCGDEPITATLVDLQYAWSVGGFLPSPSHFGIQDSALTYQDDLDTYGMCCLLWLNKYLIRRGVAPLTPAQIIRGDGVAWGVPMAAAMPVGAVDAVSLNAPRVSGKCLLVAGAPSVFSTLADDGATINCRTTLDGAIPGTYLPSDGAAITIADSDKSLVSAGSYLFAYELIGADGACLRRVSRCMHTPSGLCNILSEPLEVYDYNSIFVFCQESGRTMTARTGCVTNSVSGTIPLFMSTNGLGWFHVRPVTEIAELRSLADECDSATRDEMLRALNAEDPAIALAAVHAAASVRGFCDQSINTTTVQSPPDEHTLACAAATAAGVCVPAVASRHRRYKGVKHPSHLTGLQILIRAHHALGHASRDATIRTVKLSKKLRAGVITAEDETAFRAWPCWLCDQARMKRRPFPPLLDATVPLLGKMWWFDTLSLRAASAEYGYSYITLFVEAHSRYKFVVGHRDQTEAQLEGACLRLRSFNRKFHGEIWVGRHDNHPALKSLEWDEFILDSDMDDQTGPPYCHESSAGVVEVQFGHGVPVANALLRGSGVLSERHFFTAFRKWAHASDMIVKATRSPPASNAMIYFQRSDDPIDQELAYGSSVMYLIHPEVRDSKFEDHALPGVYVGWSIDDPSSALIWNGHRHVTVDPGCMRVYETTVLLRSDPHNADVNPFVAPDVQVTHVVPASVACRQWIHNFTEAPVLDSEEDDESGSEHVDVSATCDTVLPSAAPDVAGEGPTPAVTRSVAQAAASVGEAAACSGTSPVDSAHHVAPDASFPIASDVISEAPVSVARDTVSPAESAETTVSGADPSSAAAPVSVARDTVSPAESAETTVSGAVSSRAAAAAPMVDDAAAPMPALRAHMLVPAHEYPSEAEDCQEHGGLGWEVEILRHVASQDKVKVRYLHCTDARGRVYERWMRYSQLRPLPDVPVPDDDAVFAVSEDRCVLDSLLSRLSSYSPQSWVRLLDCAMPSYDDGFTVDIADGTLTTISADCALMCGEVVCVRAKSAEPVPVPDHDARNYRMWHVPRNEREFLRSPQKALWRSARELKMDEYRAIPVWELVPRPRGVKLLNLLWAGNIKEVTDTSCEPPTTTFQKLNPRLCVQGQNMDHDKFKSYAETMRFTFVKLLAAIVAAYSKVVPTGLYDFQFDIKNFFQSTSVVGNPDVPDLYTRQAPGFEEYGPNGEEMCYKILVAMQGRIDAMRISNLNLRSILLASGVIRRLVHEPNAFEYHVGPLAGTDASLDEIITACHNAAPSPPGSPPVGYALFGQHVDDGIGVATSAAVAQYIGTIIEGGCHTSAPSGYQVIMHQWRKLLGFDATITDHGDFTTVCLSASGALEALAVEHLADMPTHAPKHVAPSDIQSYAPGIPPHVDSADYESFVDMQRKCASLNGSFIWLQQVYCQLTQPANALSACAASFSHEHYKAARHMLMHLIAFPDSVTFGGPGCCSLELSNAGLPTDNEDTPHLREYGLYGMVDANLATPSSSVPGRPATKSVTGMVIMLAAGCFDPMAQRQHLSAPDIHTSETVAAGTATHRLLSHRALLHECHIRQVRPSPLYVDSLSSVFVANDEASVKKSVWMIRRAIVVQEAVMLRDIDVLKIGDENNLADLFTKYVKYSKWRRFMDIVLNVTHRAPALTMSGSSSGPILRV